jgi:hypothetical protein
MNSVLHVHRVSCMNSVLYEQRPACAQGVNGIYMINAWGWLLFLTLLSQEHLFYGGCPGGFVDWQQTVLSAGSMRLPVLNTCIQTRMCSITNALQPFTVTTSFIAE